MTLHFRMFGSAVISALAFSWMQAEVRMVPTPPKDQRNLHYISNRAPLAPTPLAPLPLKAIVPRGWLRKQLELQVDGFHGHFTEISRFLVKE